MNRKMGPRALGREPGAGVVRPCGFDRNERATLPSHSPSASRFKDGIRLAQFTSELQDS